MKKIIAIIATLAAIGITVPTEVKADWGCNHGARRVVSYTSCGRPVYAVYQIIGYDRCGNPVGQWVTQRTSCGCNTCNPRRPSHHHHHDSCRPGFGSFGGSSGGFFFRFGR